MKAKRPTFSICIPAYNRAHHLSRLLDSIFAQDFEDFNIVILGALPTCFGSRYYAAGRSKAMWR
jgi:hypothetical protein